MNETRIKLRHLHCFLEVARHGDIDRAAELLAVDRGAVVLALDELEELIGVPLLDHATGVLTPAGTRLRAFAARGMEALQEGVLRHAAKEWGTRGG